MCQAIGPPGFHDIQQGQQMNTIRPLSSIIIVFIATTVSFSCRASEEDEQAKNYKIVFSKELKCNMSALILKDFMSKGEILALDRLVIEHDNFIVKGFDLITLPPIAKTCAEWTKEDTKVFQGKIEESWNYYVHTLTNLLSNSPCRYINAYRFVFDIARGKKAERTYLPKMPFTATPELLSDRIIFPEHPPKYLYDFKPPAKTWNKLVEKRFVRNSHVAEQKLFYYYLTFLHGTTQYDIIMRELLRSDFNGDGIEDTAYILDLETTPSKIPRKREFYIGFATRLSENGPIIPLKLFGDTNLHLIQPPAKQQ